MRSMSSPATPARSTAALTAVAPRSVAETSENTPDSPPIGVRAYDSDFAQRDNAGKDVAWRVNAYNPLYFISPAFDGYRQYISMQINHDPGRMPALAAGIVAILGIVTSFLVRRRRVWVRARAAEGGRTVVEVGGLTLGGTTPEFDAIAERLAGAAPRTPDEE